MWIEDLTPYTFGCEPTPGRLAVGWLDRAKSFERGPVGPAVVQDRFEAVLRWAAVHRSVDAYRGYHACAFGMCSRSSGYPDADTPTATYRDEQRTLGSAQIEVDDGFGTTFVAPNLIVHYVEEHSYRPPEEFVRAALIGSWRRPDAVEGALRIRGDRMPIDEWSAELAHLLWVHLARDLGLAAPAVRNLVDIEVASAEVSCRHNRTALPSIVVVAAPTATSWVRLFDWGPTVDGTRDLADEIVEMMSGVAR